MSIVPTLGHGMAPTIFWSADAEGVLWSHEKRLDPDGCLVQQRYHIKNVRQRRRETQGQKDKELGVWWGGGNFGKKSCSGKSVFLTKAFLWVPRVIRANPILSEKQHFRNRVASAQVVYPHRF
jgi:hypothetical protein